MKFQDLLQTHRIPYLAEGHHHCRPGWIQFDCPYCGLGTGRFHMGYNLAGGYVNCWRCGKHRLIDAFALLTGNGWRKAAAELAEIPRERPAAQREAAGRVKLPAGLQALGKPHRRYLQGRGFDPDHLEAMWGIMGIGVSSRLAWRVFIPVAQNGVTVSWTTRSIRNDVQPRYLSASIEEEAVLHKKLLYGADFATNAIVIVEGPTDVWAIGPGAVATLGTSYTNAQLSLMAAYPVRAVCFDNEPAAQARARKLADQLSVFPGETSVVTLAAKDAGSASPSEIIELRKAFLGA